MSAAARRDAPGGPEGFLAALGWSPQKERDLETFRLMLEAANAGMNLVGSATLGQFRQRHFLDSAQLLWFAPQARVWADLGAGAGFPGLVLAILLKDAPGAKVHLVESVAKKARFLADVTAALGLPAKIHNARAESLKLKVELVAARACAPLTRLLGFAEPYLARGARALFLKGEGAEAEIAEARKTWGFDVEVHPSLSDPRGRVLSIRELVRGRR
jgi:16S rRNA (guanine527-N7)-methyltransferase